MSTNLPNRHHKSIDTYNSHRNSTRKAVIPSLQRQRVPLLWMVAEFVGDPQQSFALTIIVALKTSFKISIKARDRGPAVFHWPSFLGLYLSVQ